MNEGKITKKGQSTQFVIKSQKGQQLNYNEVYAICNNEIDGLMRFDVQKKKDKFKLIFDFTGYMTLKGFLRTPLNKQSFCFLLRSILSNLKELQRNYFNIQYVLMDINRVMINPSTKKVYFIYVPIQSFDSGGSLKELLLGIVQNGSFTSGEDTSYIREYMQILNTGINFSVFELEEYINSISSTNSNQTNICPKCGNKIPFGYKYCMDCGSKKLINNNIVKKETQKNKIDAFNITKDYNTACYAFLVRKKTGEQIFLSNIPFRLGKDSANNDYCITDNKAISRSHAKITFSDGHYYIRDNNSTNKTYVNGASIQPFTDYEILSDCKIRLANEDFIFYTN